MMSLYRALLTHEKQSELPCKFLQRGKFGKLFSGSLYSMLLPALGINIPFHYLVEYSYPAGSLTKAHCPDLGHPHGQQSQKP